MHVFPRSSVPAAWISTTGETWLRADPGLIARPSITSLCSPYHVVVGVVEQERRETVAVVVGLPLPEGDRLSDCPCSGSPDVARSAERQPDHGSAFVALFGGLAAPAAGTRHYPNRRVP